jgi:predicted transcriptional regulator
MKFDLDKEGLETVLLPWQAELMRRIWESGGETDSRKAHAHLRGTETPMSRATVINFLNRMADEGYLTYREATGKGGHKRLYRPSPTAPDEEGFRRTTAERIIDRARTELA